MDLFTFAFFGKLIFILLVYLILFVVMWTVRQELVRHVPQFISGRDLGRGKIQISSPGTDKNYKPGQTEAIDRDEILIGADATKCNLVINDQFVSGRHAILRWDGFLWSIEDIDSRNGTFLSTEKVAIGARVSVPFNTEISLGYQVKFKLIR